MNEWLASSLAREIWDQFGLSRKSVVTDLGCGTGEVLAHLKTIGLETFMGIESWDRREDLRAQGFRIPEQMVQLVDLGAPLPDVFGQSAHLAIALNVAERAGDRTKTYLDNAAMLSNVLVFNWLPEYETESIGDSKILWIAELQARGLLMDHEASSKMRSRLVHRNLPWYQVPWVFRRSP